jgi:hypothetical protein
VLETNQLRSGSAALAPKPKLLRVADKVSRMTSPGRVRVKGPQGYVEDPTAVHSEDLGSLAGLPELIVPELSRLAVALSVTKQVRRCCSVVYPNAAGAGHPGYLVGDPKQFGLWS